MLLPTPVVESHPEDMASDLRLVQPFPELVEFCSTVNLQVRRSCVCTRALYSACSYGRRVIACVRPAAGQAAPCWLPSSRSTVDLLMRSSRRICRWKNTSTCRSLSSCTNYSTRCVHSRVRGPRCTHARGFSLWASGRATTYFVSHFLVALLARRTGALATS